MVEPRKFSARAATQWSFASLGLVVGFACSSSHSGSHPDTGEGADAGSESSGRAGGSGRSGAGGSGVGSDMSGSSGDSGAGGSSAGTGAGGTDGPGEGGSSAPQHDAGPLPRPTGPPWQPHFELGAPGWRQSSEPLCTDRFGGITARGVWSDGDHVFALVATQCNVLAGIRCGGEGLALYENGGDGWRVLYETKTDNGVIGVSGFAGGDVIIYGGHNDCSGITHVTRDGDVRCAFVDENFLGVSAVATVGDVGYALHTDRLLSYEAPEWREVALLPNASASSLWAGDDGVAAAGYGQLVLRGKSGAELSAVAGAPAGNYTAVWSFGADVWLANTVGQLLHFDGQAWDVIDTGTGEALQLWGSADGVLYFIGDKSFGRWKDGTIELFAQRPATANMIRFTGIWGNSANEVFLSVFDQSLRDYKCSGAFMVFFDGSELHAF
jgi:hypothetical protein